MSLFHHISNRINSSDPIIILPFGGYANDERLFAQARVLEDEGITHSEEDSLVKNLWNSFKRLESDEKKDMKVKVIWEGGQVLLFSDDEGYIYLDEPHQLNLEPDKTHWIPITYQLMKGEKIIYEVVSSIMKPAQNADFGIISDMDDTIIQTGVTSRFKWRVLVNSLMKHSDQRMPLEGTHEFYTTLLKGVSKDKQNPFFYLSNSPWNLYEYLISFLEKFDFPKGTLIMRDLGVHSLRRKQIEKGNKHIKIIHLLESYPNLPFILIGDAGEKDLDIYLSITKAFPSRILSIYIRAVKKASKMARIEQLIKENKDIDILLVRKGGEMMKHASLRRFC